MAVTTTAQDIITAAIPRSYKNKANVIATDATELVNLVDRAQRGIYALAANINPTFFAAKDEVTPTAAAWSRPDDAFSIYYVEDLFGEEVIRVPIDARDTDPTQPAIYRLGQKYYSAGNENDPDDTDHLVFHYSRIPTPPAALDDTLDEQWIESFNNFLIIEVALYLAIKDGRADETQGLQAEEEAEAKLFVAFLEREDIGEVRAFANIANSPRTETAMSFLAGAGAKAA